MEMKWQNNELLSVEILKDEAVQNFADTCFNPLKLMVQTDRISPSYTAKFFEHMVSWNDDYIYIFRNKKKITKFFIVHRVICLYDMSIVFMKFAMNKKEILCI